MSLKSLPSTAAEVAKKRLDNCVKNKLSAHWSGNDLGTWEFYTYLLEQAKARPVDNAAEIAKERLERYIKNKLSTSCDDLSTWKFYNYLLERAEAHPVDTSLDVPSSYLDDHAEALKNHKRLHPDS